MGGMDAPESFNRDVFGDRGITQDAEDPAVDAALMQVEQRLKRVNVPSRKALQHLVLLSRSREIGATSRVHRSFAQDDKVLSPLVASCIPAMHTRPPATHVPAILFVICSELLAQSRLLIKEHEQTNGQGDCGSSGDGYRVGMAEDDPQANPPCCQACVHGVPHVPVETYRD